MVNQPQAFNFLQRSMNQILLVSVTTLATIVVLFPVVWMVMASVRPLQETLASPPIWVPQEFTFRHYLTVFEGGSIRYLVNGYIISISATALCLLLGSMAAYGLSRFHIRGASRLLTVLIGIQMLPPVVLIIPFFRMAQFLNIYNSYQGVVLAVSVIALPMTIWLLKSYFDSIPPQLEEAAMIDGASRLRAFYRIVLPLALPGLIGTGIMVFIHAWNALLLPIVLTSGIDHAPLTVGIASFFGQFGRDWGPIMALNTLGVLPLMVIFIVLQRYFIQGMTSGAVK